MNNGQDRPKAPARESETVRAETTARREFRVQGSPRRTAAPGAGEKRTPEGRPASGEPGKPRRRKIHPALRVLLWTLRLAIVPLLCMAALIAGLYFGYTKMGGGSSADVWNWETWMHMFDLIFAES